MMETGQPADAQKVHLALGGPTELENDIAAAPRGGACGSSEGAPKKASSNHILAIMHGLQQVCGHPATLQDHWWPTDGDGNAIPGLNRSMPAFDAVPANSGKTARLMELLEEILQPPREKVLIFTQYRGTLELLANQAE